MKNTIEASNGSRLSHMLDGVSKPNSVMQDVWERFSILVCRQTGAVAREDIVCFIIDDNMYYRSMRYKYYQLARKCKYTWREDISTRIRKGYDVGWF